MSDRQEAEQFAALLEAQAASRVNREAGHWTGDAANGSSLGATAGAAGYVALAERVTVIGQIAELSVPGPGADFRATLRAQLVAAAPSLVAEGASADELRAVLVRINAGFRDQAPVSAAQAATTILDGVRSGAWRIMVGEDVKTVDALVRAHPEVAYDYEELGRLAAQEKAAAS